MSAAGLREDYILLELENKQFSTWHRASSIGSVDICDLCLTVLLICLLRLACINESQFPLLILNVTTTLPLSRPDPVFQLTTTPHRKRWLLSRPHTHNILDVTLKVWTLPLSPYSGYKTCTSTLQNRLLWLSEHCDRLATPPQCQLGLASAPSHNLKG